MFVRQESRFWSSANTGAHPDVHPAGYICASSGKARLRDDTEHPFQLCDLMTIEVSKTGDSKAVIDVVPWLNKVTLDIIGRTGAQNV